MLSEVSPFFSKDWFGSADEYNHIQDGRWAHTPVVMLSDVDSGVMKTDYLKNSYGIVTAPWNNNPDLEVSRSMSSICGMEPLNKQIPSCESHFKLLNSTDLSEVMLDLPGVGHGPMHVNIGGLYGQCEDRMSNFYNVFKDSLDVNVTVGSDNVPHWMDEWQTEDLPFDPGHEVFGAQLQRQKHAHPGKPRLSQANSHATPTPTTKPRRSKAGLRSPAIRIPYSP